MKISAAYIVAILALVCCFPAFSFAATYAVTPLVIDKELEKRDIVTETITLTNTEDRMVRVFPTVNEVSISDGGSVQTFLEPSMTDDRGTSITSWIEIGRGRIELGPKETKQIPLTIKVHPEVAAGEYHAFIGFPEGSNRPEAERIVYNGSAPGTVIRIGVDKVESQFLRLTNFKVERFVKGNDEGKITFTLTNPGNDAVVPEGEIIFYDNRGNEVGATQINKDKVSIAPSTDVQLTEYVPNTLKMGKYKAFLAVEYGQVQKSTLNDTAFFYVLPLKQLIIIFAIILIVAVAIALYIHRRYDTGEEDDGVNDVGLYIRQTRSEPKHHDIDLSKKKDEII